METQRESDARQISIVLPVRNQADHIARIVEEYIAVLTKAPVAVAVILVVNACRDNSLDVCRALAERYPIIQVIESISGGWGLAVRQGIGAAHGDLICYTNSARTSPQDLVLLVLYAVANPGVVIKANRKIRESLWRRLGSLLYNLECRMLFDLPYWDVNGTPKVFPRAFDRLCKLERNDDLIDLEFNVMCQRAGYAMLEVPIFSTRRHGGKSTTKLGSALKLYSGAYQLKRALMRASR
ncbi:MAG TPA: glycosyltransferase [Ktedonobacterales bacterium]|nr:glycosyltransferase [Ktedonobacterales bacterium]